LAFFYPKSEMMYMSSFSPWKEVWIKWLINFTNSYLKIISILLFYFFLFYFISTTEFNYIYGNLWKNFLQVNKIYKFIFFQQIVVIHIIQKRIVKPRIIYGLKEFQILWVMDIYDWKLFLRKLQVLFHLKFYFIIFIFIYM
jgi:hypothetical protein